MLGLVGSTHCVAMCGGIVALSRAARREPSLPVVDVPRRAWPITAAQHTGRLASYAAAGALAGGAGRLAISGWQNALELLAGAAMVGLGLFLVGLLPSFSSVETIGAPLWRALRPIGQRLLPLRTPWHGLAFGALWGWLPCGLVYSALPLAVLAGSASAGALVMVAFGAGTLPALVAVGAIVRLGLLLRAPKLRVAAGALVTMVGAVHLTFAATRLHEPQASCHAAAVPTSPGSRSPQ
jgi:sulfite exporter TauE/SafE